MREILLDIVLYIKYLILEKPTLGPQIASQHKTHFAAHEAHGLLGPLPRQHSPSGPLVIGQPELDCSSSSIFHVDLFDSADVDLDDDIAAIRQPVAVAVLAAKHAVEHALGHAAAR